MECRQIGMVKFKLVERWIFLWQQQRTYKGNKENWERSWHPPPHSLTLEHHCFLDDKTNTIMARRHASNNARVREMNLIFPSLPTLSHSKPTVNCTLINVYYLQMLLPVALGTSLLETLFMYATAKWNPNYNLPGKARFLLSVFIWMVLSLSAVLILLKNDVIFVKSSLCKLACFALAGESEHEVLKTRSYDRYTNLLGKLLNSMIE
jgi:hypothetical protein